MCIVIHVEQQLLALDEWLHCSGCEERRLVVRVCQSFSQGVSQNMSQSAWSVSLPTKPTGPGQGFDSECEVERFN